MDEYGEGSCWLPRFVKGTSMTLLVSLNFINRKCCMFVAVPNVELVKKATFDPRCTELNKE